MQRQKRVIELLRRRLQRGRAGARDEYPSARRGGASPRRPPPRRRGPQRVRQRARHRSLHRLATPATYPRPPRHRPHHARDGIA
eukprot:31342-Pelagococcus_subviridis.AAC.44